ncbi:hypothetical protein GJ744_010591 [Endocarpon pusillum]|uniref:Uncharacterized protein n=1 Tax=Endocarpon pusillum TaxID=364733 RepID=A0A8H7APR4_9EURO|nr:hypothetical protein GJ744_010591 [Endocarpon pusillum]
MDMDTGLTLLTTLLSPTPLLFSWFTWLKPSTALPRIRHDVQYFTNLMAANRAAAMLDRTALVAPEELHRDHAFVEGGFGVHPAAVGNTGAAGAGATRRVQRERVSPEEEEMTYLQWEEMRRSGEEDRERKERENKKERTARGNQRGIVARVGEEETDVEAEDRAWVRSQRAAKMRCVGYDLSPGPGQGQSQQGGGGTRSVWGAPGAVPPASGKASGPSGVDIEALWGEMPALGAKRAAQ